MINHSLYAVLASGQPNVVDRQHAIAPHQSGLFSSSIRLHRYHQNAWVRRCGKSNDRGLAQAEQQRIYAADYLGMTWGTEALKAGLGMMGHASMRPRLPQEPIVGELLAELRRAMEAAGLLQGPAL